MISKTVLEQLEYPKVIQLISRYCKTEPGKEKILKTLPLEACLEAIEEGKKVKQAKEILIATGHPPIEYVQNIENDLALSKIENAILPVKKILAVLELAVVSRNVYQFLKNNKDIAPDVFKIVENVFIDKVFEHHILSILDSTGEVKDNASRKLSEIRKEMKEKNEELLRVVNRLIKNLSDQEIVREEYVTLRDGRIVIPVKAEHKRHIRGFIHSESATGQTVYIEPQETLNLNNDIVSLYFAEQREIERILKELTSKIGSVNEQLIFSLEAIGILDSIFSKAEYSRELSCSFPTIDNHADLFIKDLYHPLLLQKIGRENTVPLSAVIKGEKVILVTGPNAGGKTVALKTIGLNSLLVQSGIHIPVSPDSNFHFFDDILLDIGDKQSIEDDLSTFSSHLSNIKTILDRATNNSLIILDEIGTGTEPSAGSALAAAILIQLRDKGSLVFAATHLGTLKIIAQSTSGFQNASMEFDTKDLKPTYKFRQGMPGSSYAFEIARRIGFDDNFLILANQYVETGQDKIDKLLVDVENKSNSLKFQLDEIVFENKKLKELTHSFEKKIDKLEKEKKEILKKIKDEGEQFLHRMNKAVELVIKELRENKADKRSIKVARETFKNLEEENKKLIKEEPQEREQEYSFNIGDFAKLKKAETVGKIIELSKDKKSAELLVGTIKIRVKIDELVPSKKEKIKNTDSTSNYFDVKAEYRIDIRGQKPDECEYNIIKFIDSAYSSGLDRVEILHGKGTGALKKLVKDILTSHNGVKNFYFAPVEHGGEGITIVELK